MKTKLHIIALLLIGFSYTVQAQNKGITIEESKQIKDLMDVRAETMKLEKGFRIQIFNGSLNEADDVMKSIKNISNLPADMSFETPNYKIRVGKFRTRMEAEKALIKIKEEYPSAFVIFS